MLYASDIRILHQVHSVCDRINWNKRCACEQTRKNNGRNKIFGPAFYIDPFEIEHCNHPIYKKTYSL